MTKFETIVCLVGGNPLPIYFGIRQFAGPGAKIVLVHSAETKKVAERIHGCLPGATDVEYCPLNDARDPISTGDAARELIRSYPEAVLNFTGGTKVMSALFVVAWLDAPNRAKQAFYLDEPTAAFRFLDGDEQPLEIEPAITLPEFYALHDVVRKREPFPRFGTAENDASILSAYALGVKFADVRTEAWKREYALDKLEGQFAWFRGVNYPDWHKSEWARFLHRALGEQVAQKWLGIERPESKGGYDKSELKRQFEYISGLWLEGLVGDVLRRLGADGRCGPGTDPLLGEGKLFTDQSVNVRGFEFQCDLLAVHDSRLRYFSVTTDNRAALVKGKLFEAMHRARQIGGDLARSCVVSLGGSDVVEAVQHGVDQRGFHRVFGIADVRRWAEQDSAPDLCEFLVKSKK